MHAPRWFGLLAFGAALVAAPQPMCAQTVVGIQNLAFGTVIPGVPSSVTHTDPVRSGQIRISTNFFQNVTVRFTLPTVMNGPLGATMPITFLNTDAGISWRQSITTQTTFNPNAPFNYFIWLGGAIVYLGGRATPSPTQRGGSYTANIILTVILI